jgi:hypothetical protein
LPELSIAPPRLHPRAAIDRSAREARPRSVAPEKPRKDFTSLAKGGGYTLLFGVGAIAVIGVPLNALYFQDGRHPAPFFVTTAQVAAPAPTAPPTRSAEIAAPRPEPAKTRPEPARPAATNAVARVDPPKPQKQKPVEATKKDPIAQLLGSDAKPKGPAESDVLFAQRALLKLGYVVRADGRMTDATRQAIEKFEHDAGLPAKGALTPKLLARLAARAGLESE